MAERYLEQIRAIIRVCEDTDGILIVDKNGIIRDHRIAMNYYWKEEETVGHHIRELYPGLDENSSTILRALRTGQAIYDQRQELVNSRGEQVELDATTIPIVVNGEVEGAVDCARFYVVGQRIVRGGRRGGLSTLGRIVTQSPKMEDLKRRIRSAAQLDSPVLIYGETGTGKELVAEALHSEGPRGGEPFVAQNCAAIPSNLLESLFFGTEKGSYTGALTRKGLFEEANGGTLFLDEINSMDIGLQAKLLKALEEKKARRLGGSRDTPFDVRIVAAVNEPPEELLRSGKLREDLYYRLGVVRLNLPPLRERPEDIPLLTNYFIEQYNRSMKRNIRGVTPEVAERFRRYRWPGNIRQLRNAVEGAFAIARGELLTAEDLEEKLGGGMEQQTRPAAPAPPPEEGISLSQAVERYEKGLIQQAMKRCGSISATARSLGLSRQNLKYKLQKYDL
ncbi:sigma 54-interacting transcriptional regulator [uncultured Flavonifractor sp.]|uniref:sigma-54 interaction domain-containing protein n=1 Tax=uncultured Flavonifractor sp. TaxID=1193534 RepID=UPI00174AEE82|nr:sigma 54-interacting transcriptional regulator [uncultured Flavonifractor sp.]